MKTKFQKNNEYRQHIRKIRAHYGERAEACDHIHEWVVYTSVRTGCGMYDFEDRIHWRGENLRDSLR
jgi:hypothetical protein